MDESALDSGYTEGEDICHPLNDSATAYRLYMYRRNNYRLNLGLLSNTDENENRANKSRLSLELTGSLHFKYWYVHVASAFPLGHHYRSALGWKIRGGLH